MRKFVVAAAFVFLGACAVQEKKGDEITIEHAANQFFAAELKAQEYCESRGRVAEHLMTGPRTPSVLFIQSSRSVFHCIVPKPAK